MLVEIKTASGSYQVRVGRELKNFPFFLRQIYPPSKIAVVTDTRVGKLYASRLVSVLEKEGYGVCLIHMGEGEEYKSLKTLEEIYTQMLECGFERGTPVIALGGGVVGDLAGFAASTFMRGVPFFNVPTSLIAQADSSIGGKTGVNLSHGKNLAGTFYQPGYVHIDVSLLKTLEEKEFLSGMAEVVKHAVIKGRPFFEFLIKNSRKICSRDPIVMEQVLFESVKIKGEIVQKDEKESGLRKVLNLGHTLGHALEAELGYGKITHGQGVAAGMILAARISKLKNRSCAGLDKEIKDILALFNLPGPIPEITDPRALVKRMYFDKKVRKKRLEFVLPEKIGRVITSVPVEEKTVREALSEIAF